MGNHYIVLDRLNCYNCGEPIQRGDTIEEVAANWEAVFAAAQKGRPNKVPLLTTYVHSDSEVCKVNIRSRKTGSLE
jgi:hypothetical protein